MTAALAASRSPFAEPVRRVGGLWIALFAAAWLGIWMAQLTPIQLLLPQQVEQVVRGRSWTDDILAFGIVSGFAGTCALIAFPLTGALSDRTTSRFGRRRPWIFVGVIIFAVSLILLGIQVTIVGVGLFWCTSIIGFCVASAALTSTLSDQVPVDQRGAVSAWISAPQAIGTILGLTLVTAVWTTLAAQQAFGYPLVAGLLVALTLPLVAALPDEPLPKRARPSGGLSALLRGMWINPVAHPDFGWTLLGRILVNLGNALGTTLLLYFLQYGLRLPANDAINGLLLLTVVYLFFFVLAALVLGRISDRTGRRKVFVYISAWVQAVAALMLGLIPSFDVALVAAGILGLGYGCYQAVDQALATQVLPDATSRGKDLGIMNIATAVPQAFGPLLGALIVLTFATLATGSSSGAIAAHAGQHEGFTGLFIVSGALAVLGGIAMIPIKSVR